jgi:hypothetical protein
VLVLIFIIMIFLALKVIRLYIVGTNDTWDSSSTFASPEKVAGRAAKSNKKTSTYFHKKRLYCRFFMPAIYLLRFLNASSLLLILASTNDQNLNL